MDLNHDKMFKVKVILNLVPLRSRCSNNAMIKRELNKIRDKEISLKSSSIQSDLKLNKKWERERESEKKEREKKKRERETLNIY